MQSHRSLTTPYAGSLLKKKMECFVLSIVLLLATSEDSKSMVPWASIGPVNTNHHTHLPDIAEHINSLTFECDTIAFKICQLVFSLVSHLKCLIVQSLIKNTI